MGSIIQAATAATMTPSLPMKAPECITRPPAAMTRQLPRGGGAYARKPPPVAPLDAAKTKLPFDPLPPPPPPPKAKEPPPPPARIRMAKEREGKIPLAERLEPGDVDFGKVSFVDCDGGCGGECVCGVVCGNIWRWRQRRMPVHEWQKRQPLFPRVTSELIFPFIPSAACGASPVPLADSPGKNT